MKEEREKIARVCICIDALSKRSIVIDETLIVYAYEASQDYTLKEILQLGILSQIVLQAQNELASHE
jgi:exosome complex component RRP4